MGENKKKIFRKISIFERIKNFVSKISKKNEIENVTVNKEDIWDMYKKAKEGKIDIRTIDAETVNKLCILIKEEIKLKEQIRDKKLCILENM